MVILECKYSITALTDGYHRVLHTHLNSQLSAQLHQHTMKNESQRLYGSSQGKTSATKVIIFIVEFCARHCLLTTPCLCSHSKKIYWLHLALQCIPLSKPFSSLLNWLICTMHAVFLNPLHPSFPSLLSSSFLFFGHIELPFVSWKIFFKNK